MWKRFHTLSTLVAMVMAIRPAKERLPHASYAPPVNDPLYKDQSPYMEAIDVTGAWRRLTSTRVKRHRVTVAVVDSGVDKNHPDLVGNVVKGYNVAAHNEDTDDVTKHGTLMAGIIGAKINNSRGLAGVMDLVNILPISVAKQFNERNEAAAVDYAIRNKETRSIKILLMAFSGNTWRPSFIQKLGEADKAGILMIVTAGNEATNITINKRFPCALTMELKEMICVSATEQVEMRLSAVSNFANYVDIAAPGKKITTLYPNYKYGKSTGTSPAAAIIAGVAAMLYSIKPGLSSVDVKNILKSTAKKGLKDSTGRVTLPFGRVDADAAVAKLIP